MWSVYIVFIIQIALGISDATGYELPLSLGQWAVLEFVQALLLAYYIDEIRGGIFK